MNYFKTRCVKIYSLSALLRLHLILDFTAAFNGLDKNNWKMRQGALKFRDSVCLKLEGWRYFNPGKDRGYTFLATVFQPTERNDIVWRGAIHS